MNRSRSQSKPRDVLRQGGRTICGKSKGARAALHLESWRNGRANSLRGNIAWPERQNCALGSKGVSAAEIEKDEALLAERRKQLACDPSLVRVLTLQGGGQKEVALDWATQFATEATDFNTPVDVRAGAKL